MYLSDRDLRKLIEKLEIKTSDSEHPFDADVAIQPCSIDLRVDSIFWKQKRRRRPIDFRRSIVDQLDARRYWQRVAIPDTGSIILKPGEMILGRVYESFKIPDEYAARIVGRSSFARMGLMIACSADFINPGYHGHMPLQLVNTGSSPIKLGPFLPICQLIIVQLSSKAEKPYGHQSLESKYTDDDGGPSYWWKDKSYVAFSEWLSGQSITEDIRQKVSETLRHREIALMERFEQYFEGLPVSNIENVHAILEGFAESENWKNRVAHFWHRAPRTTGPLAVAISIARLFSDEYGFAHYAIWIISVFALIWFAWAWIYQDPPGDYFTKREFEKLDADA